jgi:hypothetical protein
MIRSGVSGLVVKTSGGFRLLHFNQVQSAFEANAADLASVTEYVNLGKDAFVGQYPNSGVEIPDFVLRSSNFSALVESRVSKFALTYLTQSAGYCCIGPDEHCYPPNKRGATDNCVVPLCPGRVP